MTTWNVTVAAWSASATLTHDLGFTPDEDDIDIRALDDLGSREGTASNITSTTVDIVLSTVDSVAHEFSVYIPDDEDQETDEYYSILATVKSLCSIAVDNVSYDAALAKVRLAADKDIDNVLAHHTTTPLVTVPDIIRQAANFIAAGLYLQRNAADEKAHPFVVYGHQKVTEYISTVFPRTGKVVASEYTHIDED